MNQKEREVELFKRFFSLIFQEKFIDSLLNIDCDEPADIIYNEQGYQITTGDGQNLGNILSATKKLAINNVEDRSVSRTSSINQIIDIFLLLILENKKLKSDKDIILLIFIYKETPFTDAQLKKRLKDFSDLNQKLLSVWKQVWCIFSDKALVIFP